MVLAIFVAELGDFLYCAFYLCRMYDKLLSVFFFQLHKFLPSNTFHCVISFSFASKRDTILIVDCDQFNTLYVRPSFDCLHGAGGC